MHEEEIVKKVILEVMANLATGAGIPVSKPVIPDKKISSERVLFCNYSNRHCHVSREALDQLYGKGYRLTKFKDLIQPGEYASNEFVTIVGPKGDTLPVRILGPVRSGTQVEISRTDSFILKIENVPVRESGKTEGTPGAVLAGPCGAYNLRQGVIVAKRHIHFTPQDAEFFGVKDRDALRVRVKSPDRALIFEDVVARVNLNYALEMHIDMDEANAAGIGQMTPAEIIRN